MKTKIGLIGLIGVVAFAVGSADAGILGERYIGVSVGQTTPGDDFVNDIDDSIIFYGGRIRLPIDANLDFVASISGSELSGDVILFAPTGAAFSADVEGTGTSLGGLLQYQFAPGAKVNPFVHAGVQWARVELEVKSGGVSDDEDDDDTGFVVGGGVEFNLDEKISINTALAYQTELFDEDDIIAGVGFNAWVSEQVLMSVVGTYNLDSEDKGISAGLALGF